MSAPSENAPTDEYLRRGPTGVATTRVAGFGAVALGAMWLGWRVLATRGDAPPWLFWPVLAIEAIVWLRLVHAVGAAWRPVDGWRTGIEGEPRIDVVVHVPAIDPDRTASAAADDLLVTLVACDTLHYPHRTWVMGSGDSRVLHALAAEHGAEVCVDPSVDGPASAVDAALALTDGDLLVLRAGDVPFPDALHATLGQLGDPTVGAVAIGTVADRGSFHPGLGSLDRHGAYEREIREPRLARRRGGTWESGPVVLRRSALAEIGALSRTGRGGAAATSARLQRAGWRIAQLPEALVAVPGQLDIEQALAARARLERDRVRALLAAPGGWPGGRIVWFDRLAEATSPIGLAALWGLLVAALVTGAPVLDGPWLPTLGLGALTAASMTTARHVVAAGRMLPGDHLAAALQLAPLRAAALGRAGAPAGGWTERTARVLALVPATLGVALAAAIGLGRTPSGWTAVAAMWLAGGAIAALAPLQGRAQRRRTARAAVDVDAVIDGRRARVVDLSLGGMGVETDWHLPPGASCEIVLLLPNGDGELREVEATGVLRWSEHLGAGDGWRHGIRFAELPAISRDRLVQFCRVVLPYQHLRFGRTASRLRSHAHGRPGSPGHR